MTTLTINNTSIMKTFLLEIGSEEIPARFVPRGLAILKDALVQFLNNASIEYGAISEYSTPRRLTIYIENVSEMQKNRTTETLGPPKKVAIDDKGNPAKAAIGFARSLNIGVEKLRTVQTERGEYIAATVEEKGRATKEVLSEELPKLISSLQLPKTMRWGDGSLRFFRPIRWVAAMLGGDVVPFDLDGIKSGDITYGHRFLSPEAIRIKDPSEYLSLLSKGGVIADHVERKKVISEGIKKIESGKNIRVHEDEELLELVTFLVEHPTPVLGSFEDKYLELPKELLITVMRTHQKYFSTEDMQGRILPNYIVVSNTRPENNDIVRKGAERVLRARLEDARFYFIEDREKPLWDYIEKLKKVTFQEKLGTLYDKVERVKSLCSFISDKLNFQQKEKLLRAAMLSKADLVTGIVREFPELQGCMGMIYAVNSGEDNEIANAIYEHYLPKSAGGSLPSGEMGTIISLADKVDNIASFFHLGLIPSGSEDPYALRRQAAGTINILQNKDYPLTVDMLVDSGLENLSVSPDRKVALSEQILQFFSQRLEGILSSQGHSYDLVNAALAAKNLNMKDLKYRIEALSELKKAPAFPALLMAAKRVYNILAKVQPGGVNETLLNEPSEKELFNTAGRVRDKIAGQDLNSLFEFEKPINTFFDSVLVMDKDERIKNNRLALLLSVKNVFHSLGDFSKIVE
ncbi:MAG: glycine--tRNA ligase subunit beta [Nitrospirae bacterium]|nr:glycine--tRNA ligase subunit beta [Nitrospirota bacterium]